jgi:ketosteroid isomerase-like protein
VRNRLVAIGVVAALTAGSICAVYVVRTSTERAIIQSYKELDSALSRKDLPGYMALLTPDYTEIRLAESPKNRQQAEANYRQIMADWTNITSGPIEIDAFNENQSGVNATVKRVARGEMFDRNGAFGARGAKHNLVSVTVSLDVWKSATGVWKLNRHNVSLVQVFVDGKLLPGGTVHDDD